MLRKLNWLSPAKLPAGSWGEYNLALCVSTEFRCFEETISLRSNLANKESMPNQELFPGWAFCIFRAIPHYKSLELWGYRWICEVIVRLMVLSLDLWGNRWICGVIVRLMVLSLDLWDNR